MLAGVPLELGGLGTGYDVLRVLQSVVLCSTAVIVFLWARSLVRPWWALAAAALTLVLPGLTYAGTLTPDVLLVPLATLAAWLAVRALEQPTRLNQALLAGAILACLLTLSEASVLALAVLAGAVVRGRVRAFVPLWIAIRGRRRGLARARRPRADAVARRLLGLGGLHAAAHRRAGGRARRAARARRRDRAAVRRRAARAHATAPTPRCAARSP